MADMALRREISKKAERYRTALMAYCESNEEPDILAISRYFGLHPASTIQISASQQWPQKRALYQASKAQGRTEGRTELALRVDSKVSVHVEKMLDRASAQYAKLAEVICSLPDEPSAEQLADLPEDRRDLERARFARRKLDLTNDLTEGFMGMVAKAADVGFILDTGRRKNAKDEGERGIDFSKLVALQINVNQHPAQIEAKQIESA